MGFSACVGKRDDVKLTVTLSREVKQTLVGAGVGGAGVGGSGVEKSQSISKKSPTIKSVPNFNGLHVLFLE